MEGIIRAIELRINVIELELSVLRKAHESLRRIPTNGAAHFDLKTLECDGRYRGRSVGAALRPYMQEHGSATLDEIREALGRGGITWGKYPKRQVKLAVVNSPKLYALSGDVVALIPSK